MTGNSADRKLVYVVEDDEEQLVILRYLFSSAGFDVVTESSADRVLAGVRSLRPDIVLLDVMLPSREGVDGFQLCNELRRDPDLQDLPIIMVSAIVDGAGDLPGKLQAQVGASDFFVKPYDPAALLQRVKELTGA